MDPQKILQDTVKRWYRGPQNEPFEILAMRALLTVNAFEEDCKLVLEGKRPIRTDYPVPFPSPKAA